MDVQLDIVVKVDEDIWFQARPNLQGMVAGLRPMLLGGWSNKALDSKLQFDDCSVSSSILSN